MIKRIKDAAGPVLGGIPVLTIAMETSRDDRLLSVRLCVIVSDCSRLEIFVLLWFCTIIKLLMIEA